MQLLPAWGFREGVDRGLDTDKGHGYHGYVDVDAGHGKAWRGHGLDADLGRGKDAD